jgi:hypothetical protein
MLATLFFAHAMAQPRNSELVTLTSEQDVWVYPHSNDPGGDPFIRVWGVGGTSVAPTPGDVENFSYGFLKFSLKGLPVQKKLLSAHLILTPAGKPVVSKESEEWPLEARGLTGTFDEKDWTQDKASTVGPKKDAIYGTGVIAAKGEDFEIRMNLLDEKSVFAKSLAGNSGDFFIALTSRYDVAEMGMKGIYKVYSRDNKDKNVHPRLELRFED